MFNLVVLIDLKKAFDTVDHQILLRKLELYGIKGQALALLKSYLTNRNQKCQIQNSFSSERLITCGVPQGSILGPLFFLLYINDLPQCLKKTKPCLFADDTNITASGDSIQDVQAAVNSDLENLRKWLVANRLSLNVAKTEFILIGSKPMLKKTSYSHPNVHIEKKQIKQVYEFKTLGVTIDQHLSWKSNTENICKKIRSGISAIRRAKPYVSKETLISYIKHLCALTSIIAVKYGMFLVKHNQKDYKKLQNRAARVILGVSNDVNHTIALHALGWEPLKMERKKAKGKMMYKILNKMGSQSLINLFSYKSDKTEYHLRDISSRLCLSKPRTDNMKNSFMYDGAKIWNSIPKDIRESKSPSSLRHKIAAHIFEF